MTLDPSYADPMQGSGIDLDMVLPSMERRAEQALLPDERARIINLAGDLCFDAGARERALEYYDRAIDTYLSVGLYASAVAVCQKIVRLTPEVIRARCTLAWLAIARGMLSEARDRIHDYADAAGRLNDSRLAWGHLRMMAEVCESQEVLESVADALLQLGDVRGADRVYGAAYGGELATRKLPEDPQSRWGVVLERIMTAHPN
jgi:tetratricopeptide (TPR) repeat protein